MSHTDLLRGRKPHSPGACGQMLGRAPRGPRLGARNLTGGTFPSCALCPQGQMGRHSHRHFGDGKTRAQTAGGSRLS